MSEEKLFSPGNVWFTASIGATAVLAVLSLILGFVVLPYAEPNSRFSGIWDAICSAAGVPRASLQSATASVKPTFKTTDVVLTTELSGSQDARSIGRGATSAQQCAICHGVNRPGSQVDTPNLEGQPVAAIYKQLRDFKTGARTNAVMSPFAVNLTDQHMRDLAAYYSYLPRQAASRPGPPATAPTIVSHGASMRNVPACVSCHSPTDAKLGSPWLDGQSAVYVKTQLQAFATGTRRNDINEQMRNIARRMTPQEIEDAARYFASRP